MISSTWRWGGTNSSIFTSELSSFLFFLRIAEFPNNKKTQLRIGGEHKGQEILFRDDTGELKTHKCFNRKNQYFKEYQRTSISHNLSKIYEGITISYAPFDLNSFDLFHPFARDSEGELVQCFIASSLLEGEILSLIVDILNVL